MESANAEQECDSLATGMGYTVTRFSQKARAQVPNIPDRYLRHTRGVCLWWECKQGRDKLTRGQYTFLSLELTCNGLAGCGNVDHLRSVLMLLTRDLGKPLAQRRCRELIDVLAAKGFRDEKVAHD